MQELIVVNLLLVQLDVNSVIFWLDHFPLIKMVVNFVAPKRIAAGYAHNLSLVGPRENGASTSVYGWGKNDHNRIGLSSNNTK